MPRLIRVIAGRTFHCVGFVVLRLKCITFTGYIGGSAYTKYWLGPYLEANYGQNVASLVPHGVIVMDTMMNYDTKQNSQIIPREFLQEVSERFD